LTLIAAPAASPGIGPADAPLSRRSPRAWWVSREGGVPDSRTGADIATDPERDILISQLQIATR
jgi:hypothetical protein